MNVMSDEGNPASESSERMARANGESEWRERIHRAGPSSKSG